MSWAGAEFTLLSPHTPETCIARLRETLVSDGEWLRAAWSRKPLRGTVEASSVRARINNPPRSPYLLHPFQLLLTATLEPSEWGTRLKCQVERLPSRQLLGRACALLWLALGVVGAGVMLVEVIRGGSMWEKWWVGPLVPISCLLLWFQPRSARREARYLAQVMCSWLDAQREDDVFAPSR